MGNVDVAAAARADVGAEAEGAFAVAGAVVDVGVVARQAELRVLRPAGEVEDIDGAVAGDQAEGPLSRGGVVDDVGAAVAAEPEPAGGGEEGDRKDGGEGE